MAEKPEKLGASFSKAVGGKLKLKGVEFKGKKAIVTKEKIETKPSNEDAAAGRVSNLQVHKCQQHYRVIQTPDGNQTVALKSTSREKDLDNRVKTKSDRFCMHT